MLNSLGLEKSPQNTKVCVAMSGGVDSSATAYLLKKQGYQVFGLTMDLLTPPYAPQKSSIEDARKVADQLGIEHHFLDLKKEFRKQVIDYFCHAYKQGLTPSPCIMCNKDIKVGLLADKARELGADILVTGHYAETKITANGVELYRGKDLIRDQSYFLFAISKQNLQMLRCPLAAYSKEQTRALAKEAGLEIANKSDSQDICFVSDGKYAQLIKDLDAEFQNIPGNIVNRHGKILGQHKGLINYTIGQRRGLGIGGGDILYVLELDAQKNQVIVGSHEELKQQHVLLENVNWLGEDHPEKMDLMVKLRSRQDIVPAEITFLENKQAFLRLKEDFFGVAPGQGCCFYHNNRVLGGGFISKF